MKESKLIAPFPWFGGKSKVANIVWPRIGCEVYNYVEPFFGSGSMLFGRPGGPGKVETVNDKDGYVCNFWRAIRSDPEEVAYYADRPVNECDLTAVNVRLTLQGLRPELVERLEGDLDYCDAKIAGLWVWGLCCWIGGGWASADGPWYVSDDGRLLDRRKLPRPSDAGMGVTRRRPHLGWGRGVLRQQIRLLPWFADLANRLQHVRVCCGDWRRVLGNVPTCSLGTTAVFLDPPYGGDVGRDNNLYATEDLTVAAEVQIWCVENGNNKKMRIALCGYEGEHNMIESLGWTVFAWKTEGGYSTADNPNKNKERIWFSPHCLAGDQLQLVLF